MPVSTQIRVNTNVLSKRFATFKNNSRVKINTLKRIGIFGENVLKDEAEKIRAFGTLANSMTHEVESDKSVSVFSRLEYAEEALETGRAPGKMPPVHHIEKWVKKKGIGLNPYLVARSIGERGTRKYRRRGPKQVTRARAKIAREVPKVADKFIRKFYDSN